MSSLLVKEIGQFSLPTDSLNNRNNFSDLTLNTLGVLGNFAIQCKRVLPKEASGVLTFVKCLSFVSVGNNFNLASINIEKSTKIKDAHGKKLNEVKLIRSGMQFLSGILYFSSLGLSWAGSISSFKAVIVASKIFSKTTTVLSNSAGLLMLLITSMKLYEQDAFQQELSKKLSEIEDNPNLSSQKKEEAIANFLKEQIRLSKPLQEQLKTMLQERYNNKSTENTTNSKKDYYKDIDSYVATRFPKEVVKKELAKTAYMERVTNRSCIKLIKEIDLKSAAIGPTVKKVQEVMRKNRISNLLAIGLSSIGLLALAVSWIPGSVFVTLSAVLGLIPTVAFSILGVNDLIQSLHSNKEGLYDRLVLVATGCVGIVTSTALYALTENALVKCAAILFSVIWLSLLYYVSLHLENQPKSA